MNYLIFYKFIKKKFNNFDKRIDRSDKPSLCCPFTFSINAVINMYINVSLHRLKLQSSNAPTQYAYFRYTAQIGQIYFR